MNGTGLIYELIPRVMDDIGAVAKAQRNNAQGYSFRGIDQFYQAAHPAMVKNGVFCAPEVVERDVYRFDKINAKGDTSAWIHVALKVRHRFFAKDGSSVDVVTCGEGLDNSDKATNKAMSAAMKYALIELFCVPTQDVEDPDRDSPETGTRRPNGNAPTIAKPIPIQKGVNERIPASDSGGEKLVTAQQATALHLAFKDELREPLRSDADKHLYAFLTTKMCVDSHGNPSASMIPAASYVAIRQEAIKFARGL